ncbi:MAG: hydrogenase accessory protein HypB [Candidatus Zixiibacteriota bacterium]|nr:MAG: hydrogenase accessory protein HypB [candidate division Zixibacteria bacterium]
MGKTVDVKSKILAENDRLAHQIRERFSRTKTLVVNLVSSPGSGKTTLLEATAKALTPRLRMACVVGDVATERDAERLKAAGMPAYQILTGGGCHLDARLVSEALAEAHFEDVDLLFIENVGNLICPTSYDLGEDFKVALLSVTEGDDKPFKYPAIFSRAAAAVITKADLLAHVHFDLGKVREEAKTLNPDVEFMVTSALGEPGIGEWTAFLEQRMASKRAQARVGSA